MNAFQTKNIQHITIGISAVTALILFSAIAWISTDAAGGEDSVQHYLIARYAFKHPHLFLDHWGKPVFTLLAAPFAQFGMFGARFYNIVIGILTAIFCYRVCRLLNIKYAFAAFYFLLFATQYFYVITSSITEVTFSFILCIALYFTAQKKYTAAALWVSFLPFARSEAVIVMGMFLLFFSFSKNLKYIPLVFFGTLLYSIIGYFHFDDFLWVWHQFPYSNNAAQVYGHGEFLHYVIRYDEIAGTPLTILLVLGTLMFIGVFFYTVFRKKVSLRFYLYLFLVFGSFYGYLFGHSYVWWKGISASFGLVRVMTGVLPCVAIIAVYGIDAVLGHVPQKFAKYSVVVPVLLVVCVILRPFKIFELPYTLDEEKKTIFKAGEWYLQSEHNHGARIFYFAPTVALAFQIDPFDSKCAGGLVQAGEPESIPAGSIVVWDAHFGPNECGLPLDSMKREQYYELLKKFKPETDVRTLNNYVYEVYLFRKK